MADYKMQFIQDASVELSKCFDNDSREMAVDAITRTLQDYDVKKQVNEIIPYRDVNAALLKRYCACLLIEGKSAKTVQQYRRTAERLAEITGKLFNETSVYDIRYFLACEKQNGVSNRTLENYRANLSAFFQWLFREELTPKNPCTNIPPIKYVDKVRLPFSAVEIDKMRGACNNQKERAIIEFLLASGVRVSELCALMVRDVDFNTLSVHVKEGKGGKERIVYITDLAAAHLKAYLFSRSEVGDSLFYTRKHKPIQPGGIRHLLRKLGARAEIDEVHPHRFRRTFATGMADRGMGVQDIQKLLGHSNINTTMEYVYTSDEKAHASYMRYSA